ncbi:unnamed protein product [Dovyalis caffra]|uniref:Uncharacterized protein n=1 Tax=Dovyalis caffra TaxID=77055 RepID=A0AAV1SBC7_9ROSI|nr:unnamed protein product [Dovyalis caffra]
MDLQDTGCSLSLKGFPFAPTGNDAFVFYDETYTTKGGNHFSLSLKASNTLTSQRARINVSDSLKELAPMQRRKLSVPLKTRHLACNLLIYLTSKGLSSFEEAFLPREDGFLRKSRRDAKGELGAYGPAERMTQKKGVLALGKEVIILTSEQKGRGICISIHSLHFQ